MSGFSRDFWNGRIRKAGRIIYALGVSWCFPAFLKQKESIEYTYSVFSVILFILVLWSVRTFWAEFRERRLGERILTGVLSFTFLLCMVWGSMLDTEGYLNLRDIRGWAAPIIAAPCVAMLISRVYNEIEKHSRRRKQNMGICPVTHKELARYFVFLLVCWGIVLLGVFPGFFVYDAGDEILQVITRRFTTHHPLLHVLYMGGAVQAGYKLFGDYNAGIFLFSLIQMLLFAAGIVYMAAKMHAFGFGRRFCRIIIVFMGIFPVIPMCVLCSAKDSIFALILLLWMIETYEWLRFSKKSVSAKWVIWSVLLCLLRHNALYALVLAAVFVIIFEKKRRGVVTVLLTVSVMAATLISSGLAGIFRAADTEHQEILTVPIQQIARTCQQEPEVFSQEERELLYGYLPEAYLDCYRDKLSDGVKIGFVNEAYERNPAGFWRIWLSGLKRAPISYLNAWLLTSYGYWYPDTIVDVYTGNTVYTFTYGDNSYFGYETEEPGRRNSLIPPIDNFYRKLSLEIYKEKLPVVSMLFSQGFVFWILLLAMGYLIRTDGFGRVLPYLILVFMVATLLLGPTFLPRYVFFLWFCVPFVLGDVLSGNGKDDIV